MRRLRAIRVLVPLLLAASLARGADDKPARARSDDSPAKGDEAAAERLSMSPAIACRSIAGFEDYETLPDAALTADEKLLVYFRPANYRVEKSGGSYHVHLTQDGQVRRRGEKPVLLRKEKLLEYELKMDRAPNPIYLRNTVSLKGLKPGEYDFDIILHDKLSNDPPARQTLPFKVVPAALPKAGSVGDGPEADPEAAPKPKAKAKAGPKRRRPAR